LLLVIRSGWGRRIWGWLTKKFGGLPQSLTLSRGFSLKALGLVVVIYFIGSLAWYGWAASGYSLNTIVGVLLGQAAITTSELLEPTTREPLIQTALGLDFLSASTQGKGFRIFQYITQLFIIIGFIRLVFKPKKLKFTAEFIAFAVVSGLLLLLCIFLPRFSVIFNVTRFYHITLFLLAPLCILGGEAIWQGISSIWRKTTLALVSEDNQAYLRFLTLAVLIPYFLFTSGFVFEVSGHEVTDKIDTPYSIALSSYRVDVGGVLEWRDSAGVDWLLGRLGAEHTICVDCHGVLLFIERAGLHCQLCGFQRDVSEVPEDSYMYFRTWNIDRQEITFQPLIRPGLAYIGLRQSVSFDELGLDKVIESRNRIYNNGGAQILAPR